MPTYRKNLYLGTTDPLWGTDDIADGAITLDKLSDEVKELIGGGATKSVDIPATPDAIDYDGEAHTIVAASDGYTIDGENSVTDAGSHSVTLKLNSGYKWSDSSKEDKTITLVINKKSVTKPNTKPADIPYDGNVHTFATDGTDYKVSGNTSGTDVGSYTVIYTLNDTANTQWSDGTTTVVTVTFHIVEVFYAYYGSSASVPDSVDTTNKSQLPLSSTINIVTTNEQQKKCHWVAVKTTSGYSVTKAVDVDGEDYTDMIGNKVIGVYTLYYLSSTGYIDNTTKFTISK